MQNSTHIIKFLKFSFVYRFQKNICTYTVFKRFEGFPATGGYYNN